MEDVDQHLAAQGFHTSEKTYHDGHLPAEIVEHLQLNFTPTALFFRASADRIAVHTESGFMFYYDAKTSDRETIAIEALPLVHHILHAGHGVLCLYCCRAKDGVDRGFWAHQLPAIGCAFLPCWRWSPALIDWYENIIRSLFPTLDLVKLDRVNGSGDPFFRINANVVETLPTWQSLIEQKLVRWPDPTEIFGKTKPLDDEFQESVA
jgi:hypothetical protein